jgi:CHAT domain-containing protein/Tfp pilus assembly protein PilF
MASFHESTLRIGRTLCRMALTATLSLSVCERNADGSAEPASFRHAQANAGAPDAPQVLEPGKRIERELSGGKKHSYRITLADGQYTSVIVEQHGIDVVLRLVGSDRKLIAEVDDDISLKGNEKVELVSETAASYELNVETKQQNAAPGGYEISVAELRTATEKDRSIQRARELFTESVRLSRAGKYDEALLPGEQALEIREQALGPDHADVAKSLFNLANIQSDKGDYAKAEPLYRRALEIRERALGPDHISLASYLNNLGLHYSETGDYAKAQPLLRRGLEILERTLGPDNIGLGNTLNNLAGLYNRMGDVIEAERLYTRALAIREKALGPEHPDVAQSLNNLANLYVASDYNKAESLYQRALEIRERARGPDHPSVAQALFNLANLYDTAGDFAKSEPRYLRSLAILEKALGAEHPFVTYPLNGLAVLNTARGDFAKAEPQYQRVLTIRERALGPDHPLVAESLAGLAALYALQGNLDQAVKTQLRTNAITEHNIALNLVTGSERQKLAYLASLSENTDRTLSLYIRNAPQNSEARDMAITSILQRKGRVQDAMADSLAALRRRFSAEDRRLFDRLSETTSQLARLVLNGPEGVSLVEHQNRIKTLADQREKLEAEISLRSAGFYERSEPVTLGVVQTAIPDNAALIEVAVYHPFDLRASISKALDEARYVACVVSRQGGVRCRELGEAKLIDEAITDLRRALRDPKRGDVQQLARAVDAKVMQPLRALAGNVTHLLMSPDGALNLIPFEALVDEHGKYLIERYSFSYLTSGRDLLRLQVARASKSAPLVMADPLFGEPETAQDAMAAAPGVNSVLLGRKRPSVTTGGDLSSVYFATLRGTAQEAHTIKSLFPEASVLEGKQATESALKRVDAPRLLHIATHGFFLQDAVVSVASAGATRGINASVKVQNPLLRSGLALAGANLPRKGGEDDGVLTALEATGLNLWGTKLVTLSACDTGLGEVKNGEGVYGLRRAFFLAGTETLVMSLWPVSDYVTRELMIAYYKGLRLGQGRGAALRQVQLSMLKRKERRHPFYWASFIQSGEWANLEGKR